MRKVFLAVLLAGVATHVFAQNGIIREMSGEVELRHAGATDFVPASIGSVVAQDTIVSTGFRSNAVIEVGSSMIAVRPLTRLSLAEIGIVAGEENVRVNLQAGRVRVDVRPPAGTMAGFTVQGPSATASVRGTSFDFDARSVNVLDGAVSFRGTRGAPVMVQAGGESAVAAGGRVADPVQVLFQDLSPSVPVGADGSGEAAVVPVVPAPVPVVPPATGGVDITVVY